MPEGAPQGMEVVDTVVVVVEVVIEVVDMIETGADMVAGKCFSTI